MKKRILYLLIFVFITQLSLAQQTTQYSQWVFNQFAINPALAGVKRCLDVRMAVRAQWLGFKGAPVSGLFTINAPLQKRSKRYNDFFHGIGGKIEEDRFGPFNNFAASVAYAIHFPIGRHQRLSFGAEVGVQQFGFDNTKVTTIAPDPAVGSSSNEFLFPLLGFGAWYTTEYLYFGASIDQLAKNKWKDIGFTSRFRIHTKLQAGAQFTFSNNNSILPGLLVRIPPAGPVSLDLNVMFSFKNNWMLGIGYRNTDALIAFLKVNIKKFTIGYSFDFVTSAIRGGQHFTHEISFQYIGCRKGRRSQSACPLFN